MRADGTDSQLVDENAWAGIWSPVGHQLAMLRSRSEQTELITVDLAEDECLKRRTFTGEHSPHIQPGFRFSPDGKQLAWIQATETNSTMAWELAIADLDQPAIAPQIVRLAEEVTSSLVWSPDSRRLLFSTRRIQTGSHRLCEVAWEATSKSTSASQARPLTPVVLEGQMPDRRNTCLAWLPDGRTLLYLSRPQRN